MASKGTTLVTNDFLSAGDFLRSANGEYMAIMQGDGNFVLYKGDKPLWASNTVRSNGDYFAIMQGDGNLVVYSGTLQKMGPPLWASGMVKGPGSYALVMQDDGNLEVFQDVTSWE